MVDRGQDAGRRCGLKRGGSPGREALNAHGDAVRDGVSAGVQLSVSGGVASRGRGSKAVAPVAVPRVSGEVTLEAAIEMIAELGDFEPRVVERVVLGSGVRLFFQHARRNGDGSWRVPGRDLRSLLGEGVPERVVSVRTFAEWCEVHPITVTRAVKRGELRMVVVFGEWRIPVSEFCRLLCGRLGRGAGGKGVAS